MSNQPRQRDDELGALWRKRGDGKPDFFTGSCICPECGVKTDIVAFENGFRQSENQPEYRILKSRPKGDGRHAPSTRRDEQERLPAPRTSDQLRDPKPPSRFATLGGRDEQGPRGNRPPAPQAATWPPRGQQVSRNRQQPSEEWDSRNNAKGADDWTGAIPHPADEDDIPF
jgi:hypothetical protein